MNTAQTIHQSDNVHVQWHQEGFLEATVSEGKSFSAQDRQAVADALMNMNISDVRVLMSRLHRYAPPQEYIYTDLASSFPISITKIAFFALSAPAQTLSHLVGATSLQKITYKIFSNREAAISWLLD